MTSAMVREALTRILLGLDPDEYEVRFKEGRRVRHRAKLSVRQGMLGAAYTNDSPLSVEITAIELAKGRKVERINLPHQLPRVVEPGCLLTINFPVELRGE